MTIDEINKKIDELTKLRQFLINNQINDNDPVETIIFKKYIEIENVSKVAAYINSLGFRVKSDGSDEHKLSERKYTSNDISDMITDKNAPVEKELKDFTAKLFKFHKNKMLKLI